MDDIGLLVQLDDEARRLARQVQAQDDRIEQYAGHVTRQSTAHQTELDMVTARLAGLAELERRYARALKDLQQQAAEMKATSATVTDLLNSGQVIGRRVVVRAADGSIDSVIDLAD